MSSGTDTFGRAVVVRTTGGVHVMVSREPIVLRDVNPAFELNVDVVFGKIRHIDLRTHRQVLRSSCHRDGVVSRRQRDRLTIGAIDLVMKEKVGGESARRVGIDASLRIANHEGRRGWFRRRCP